jgi:hypothetical protein
MAATGSASATGLPNRRAVSSCGETAKRPGADATGVGIGAAPFIVAVTRLAREIFPDAHDSAVALPDRLPISP